MMQQFGRRRLFFPPIAADSIGYLVFHVQGRPFPYELAVVDVFIVVSGMGVAI
ncbi:MAG: hypothetical protein AAF125_04610 [Chloroflexota bacterium]